VIEVLKDVYTSLIHHGVENIVTVNGHRMANLPAIETASKQTKEDHPDVFFATMDMVKMGVRIYNDMRDGDPEAGMHGGEFETSFMMANHADLVKEEEFVLETSERWTRFTSLDYTSIDDSIGIAGSMHDWGEAALGHQGDPTHASAEKGEELVERLVDNAEEFLADLWALRTKQRESGGESLGLSY
jgi:creatinine amidohydrolase